jgi:hypothetical protein
MRQIITHGTRRRDTAQPHHSAGHPYTTRSGARRWRSPAAEFVVKKARLLFARRDFPRRHAELIDVPIADDHLDRGQHSLSLGVAVPLGSQALNLKLNCCIGIVSHDPVPLTMKAANFRSEHGGGWAFLWRNLGGVEIKTSALA